MFSPGSCCANHRSGQPKNGGGGLDFIDTGAGFELKPVPKNNVLDEQAEMEKKVDLS